MKQWKSPADLWRNPYFHARYGNLLLIYAFLLVLMVAASIFDENFLTVGNFKNLMLTSFPLLMVTFAQSTVIFTGGINLSLGATVALTNVCCVLIMDPDSPMGFLLPIGAGLLVGTACGLMNGLLIAKGKIPAIITTTATTAIFEGAALLLMNEPGGKIHRPFARFLTGDLLGIPVAFYLFVVLLAFMRLLTNNTPYGKALRAIGGNESASFSTGIKVDRVKIIAYTISGLLAAVAGIFLSAQMFSADPRLGKQYSMNAVTASVLGGVMLTGAVGDMAGTVAGVFTITVINNMLNLIGVSSYYQFVFQGLILIIVLYLPTLKEKRAEWKLKRGQA